MAALVPGTRALWAVATDGRVAVVEPDPYRVSYILPTGERRTGPPVSVDRRPVTDSVKAAYLSERRGSQGIMVTDGSGKTSIVKWQAPRLSPESIRWTREIPPFRGEAFVAFAPDGLLLDPARDLRP